MLGSYDFSNEINSLINLIKMQFEARTTIEGRASGKDFRNAEMITTVKDGVLWITIATDDELHNITVPLPYTENNITRIKVNEVERAICNHFDVATNKMITYLTAVQQIFISDYSGLVITVPIKKTIFIQSLAYSILNNNMSVVVYNLQKAINELVSKMPLHETNMNSWMMNNRLILIDQEFDCLDSPTDRLKYQVDKNIKYYDAGWTSIGLSDGTLADKNYILALDIRKYTAFGIHHHNPQRNLYSTLCMMGDELPTVRSESAQKLIQTGITRKGWNWFTAFVDIPDTFEDQIVIDKRHANKVIYKERRFQCFGEMLVKEGQHIKHGTALSSAPDGGVEVYKIKANKSWIKKITRTEISVGGNKKEVFNVVIAFNRTLKDGTKITNTHGNKGVIHLEELGYAIDPLTGQKRKLDVIVSAKSIKKRGNDGQILECLFNNLAEYKHGKVIPMLKTKSVWGSNGVGVINTFEAKNICPKPIVIPDEYVLTEEGIKTLKNKLNKYGFDDTCTWQCDTYAGKVTAVCGTVFWGVSKNVEDQLWGKKVTELLNGKNLRTAGLKFSTVEFKALETRFGHDNPIIKEVLSYTQGIENLNESLQVLKSKKAEVPEDKPTINITDIQEVDQSNGTIFSPESLAGTIADEFYYPEGFILRLPVLYQTAVGHNSADTYEGAVVFRPEDMDWKKYKNMYIIDRIYVPIGLLRRSWRHASGLYGMSELSVLLNNIVAFSKRYAEKPEEQHHLTMLYRSIGSYFARVASSISTKKGDISNLGLSVRYPYSAKAVATLSNKLPPNTIQIHKDMAQILDVVSGDIVITERFPCLGFMGVRPQQVHVSSNEACRYTIRVSGNSLVSQNLDYDGDVLYVASFHTLEAKKALREEWESPNEDCWKHIDQLNNRKGVPHVRCLDLNGYNITPYPKLTKEAQAEIVEKLTGIKAQTGPVIALTYNLMRITENSGINITRTMETGIEMFVEKAGQSVFEQKHGGQSLHDIVVDAICTGDVNVLIEKEFDVQTSKLICDIIKDKASKLGIFDLVDFHEKIGKNGSNILNKIIRKENKLYFASRSNLEACELLEYIAAPVVDLPSRIFKLTMSGKYNGGKTILDARKDRSLLNLIKDSEFKQICKSLFERIDKSFGMGKKINKDEKLLIAS